ncbi:ricin-type beta-trefoil lectin domain protein [Ceratobasidium sp. AG-Ba]|nr:ricin-type beta-trefoil lectin domain protein [Ceratobasidium sp. AG-Ba]
MPTIEPGTYKITSVHAGTCIAVKDERHPVCSKRRDTKDQQWYVRRSGAGYHIQSCYNGAYLAVSETRSASGNSIWMLCGQYPATWAIYQEGGDNGAYIIEHGDNGRVVDLWRGLTDDGAKICTYPKGDWPPANRKWKFERLSNNTGETESQSLDGRFEQLHKAEIALKDIEIAFLKEQIASQTQELSRVKRELVEESARLSEARQTLRDQTLGLFLAGVQRTNDSQVQEARRFQERLDALEQVSQRMSDGAGAATTKRVLDEDLWSDVSGGSR